VAVSPQRSRGRGCAGANIDPRRAHGTTRCTRRARMNSRGMSERLCTRERGRHRGSTSARGVLGGHRLRHGHRAEEYPAAPRGRRRPSAYLSGRASAGRGKRAPGLSVLGPPLRAAPPSILRPRVQLKAQVARPRPAQLLGYAGDHWTVQCRPHKEVGSADDDAPRAPGVLRPRLEGLRALETCHLPLGYHVVRT